MAPETLTQKWTHSTVGKIFHTVCTGSMIVAAIATATSLVGVPGALFGNIWGHLQMLPDAVFNLPALFGAAAAKPAVAAALPLPLPILPDPISSAAHLHHAM